MNPAPAKKGISHTFLAQSKDVNLIKKQPIVINEVYEQHPKQYIEIPPNRANMHVEQLHGAKFANSIGYSVERPGLHFKYVNGTQSGFVPPPPERFLINSGQSYSQPSQLPINSTGQVQTIQTVQPLYQSIKRTFVPHHIYNQIPVMNSQTKHYYEVNQEVSQQKEQQQEEADNQLFQQYDRLYECYQNQLLRVEELQRKLKEQRERKQSNGSQLKQVTKEIYIEKPKKIDIKQLSALIMRKKKGVIDQIVERKKNSCINKLRALFSEEQSSIKTAMFRSSEEFTTTKVRIK